VDESLALRRYLRRHAYFEESIYDPRYAPPMRGWWARLPVRVVPGDGAPRYAGEGWRYETRGGKPIRNPVRVQQEGLVVDGLPALHAARRSGRRLHPARVHGKGVTMASEQASRRQVATYLTDNDYTELLSEAEKLDVNVSTMLRLIVRDWLTLQDRSAVASRRAGEGEDR
jgi:hypothetical protein